MIITRYLDILHLDDNNRLLINFLSGDATIADLNNTEALLNLSFDEKAGNYWKEHGYLFESDAQEQAEVQRLLSFCAEAEGLQRGLVVTAIPTYKCNCSCTYCFEGRVTKGAQAMTPAMVDAMFACLEKEQKNPEAPLHLTLFGGEPLLQENLHLISHILEKSHRGKSFISIVTNGTTLDFYLDLLKKHEDIVKHIQVTIDGPQEIHDKKRMFQGGGGTFDLILDNVAKLLKKMPDTGVNARTNVLSTDDFANFIPLYRSYEERGLTGYKSFAYYLSPVKIAYGGCQSRSCVLDEYEFFKQALKALHEENPLPGKMYWSFNFWQMSFLRNILGERGFGLPRYKNCGAQSANSYVFGPEGLLYACWEEIGKEKNAAGTWYPEWSLTDYGREWQERKVHKIPQCAACKYAFLCAGGCGSKAKVIRGSLNAPFCMGEKTERKVLQDVAKFLWMQSNAKRQEASNVES